MLSSASADREMAAVLRDAKIRDVESVPPEVFANLASFYDFVVFRGSLERQCKHADHAQRIGAIRSELRSEIDSCVGPEDRVRRLAARKKAHDALKWYLTKNGFARMQAAARAEELVRIAAAMKGNQTQRGAPIEWTERASRVAAFDFTRSDRENGDADVLE